MDYINCLTCWNWSYYDNTQPLKNRKYMYFPFRQKIEDNERDEQKLSRMVNEEHDFEQYDCELSEDDLKLIADIKAATSAYPPTFCCEHTLTDSCNYLCSTLTCRLCQGWISDARTRAFKKFLKESSSTYNKQIRYRQSKNEIFAIEFDLDGPPILKKFLKEFHVDLIRRRIYSTGILTEQEIEEVTQDIELLKQLRVYTNPPSCCCIVDYEAEEFYYNHPYCVDLLRIPILTCCFPYLHFYYGQDPAIQDLAANRVVIANKKSSVNPGSMKSAILYMENWCCLGIPIGYSFRALDIRETNKPQATPPTHVDGGLSPRNSNHAAKKKKKKAKKNNTVRPAEGTATTTPLANLIPT